MAEPTVRTPLERSAEPWPEFWTEDSCMKWQDVEYCARLVRPACTCAWKPPSAGWPLAVYFPSMDPNDGDIDGLVTQFAAVAPEPFVLAVPRRQALACWFIDDTSYWGWVQGDFRPELLDSYCQWLTHLSHRPGINGARVGVFGYAAGAYAAAEVFAHTTVKLSGVGLAGVHGHGQPDLDGLHMKRACLCPTDKFACFLGRLEGHSGAGWIEATHAERDPYARILDARHIVDTISERQANLSLPRVILRMAELGDEDKHRETSSSYFRFAFVREEFFTGLFAGSAMCLQPPRIDVCSAIAPERTDVCSAIARHVVQNMFEKCCLMIARRRSEKCCLMIARKRVSVDDDVQNMFEKLLPDDRKEAFRALKILAPLRRRWHSSRFGEVRPATSEPVAVEDAVVQLHLECSGPIFCCNIFVQGKGVFLVCGSERFRLSPGESDCRSGPVVWNSEADTEREVWSSALADAEDFALRDLQGKLQLPDAFLRPRDFSPQAGTGQLTVGFCITLKNRLWQLKHSLPLNLANLWPHRKWVRVHLVDFGSSDGALEFITSVCRVALEDGLLHLHNAKSEFFHASIAKNTAHMVATEDVLVNLDCDNLVDVDYAPEVRRHFEEGAKALHFSGSRGTCGRIACLRNDFLRVGGYDEDAHPFGNQDLDLVARLKLLHGKALVRKLSGAMAIPNTKKDTIREVDPNLGITWAQMDAENRLIFRRRRAEQGAVRNTGHKPGVVAERWMVEEIECC